MKNPDLPSSNFQQWQNPWQVAAIKAPGFGDNRKAILQENWTDPLRELDEGSGDEPAELHPSPSLRDGCCIIFEGSPMLGFSWDVEIHV